MQNSFQNDALSMLGHLQVGVSCEDFLQIDEISSKVRGKKNMIRSCISALERTYICLCARACICMYVCMYASPQTLVGFFPPRSIYVLFSVVDSGDKRRFSQFSRHSWCASGV